MKVYLEKIIIINRAPFTDKLELNFKENEVSLLSAVNGKGKTTILSHLADAFFEIAKNYYSNVTQDPNSFYRVSSALFNSKQSEPSFVYFRFKIKDDSEKETILDYLDIRNECTKEQYDTAINLEHKIDFDSKIKVSLLRDKVIKIVSDNLNKEIVEKMFNENIITYFPSYRFEIPGYLNEPNKIKLDFSKTMKYAGILDKPLEVVSGLPTLVNWILDIVLDIQYGNEVKEVKANLDNLITKILVSKKYGGAFFAVGQRNLGSTRIQILKASDRTVIYPSVFNLSSGEASLLCLFGEIIRQADINKINIKLDSVTGIVLIDEIDKHLHIKLQKEILPNLLKLFPNVQFIITAHSPFLSMGLTEVLPERSKIKDLDTGLDLKPFNDPQYDEVYQMMLAENEKFKEMYVALKSNIASGNLPLIITEGKTDILHIKKAKESLEVVGCDIDFSNLPISEKGWGAPNLEQALIILAKDKQPRKIIGIFDRDRLDIVLDIEKDGASFKDFGNNVYAFCIPKLETRAFDDIEIEHYYSNDEIKKEDSKQRRLFLGDEFYLSGNSIDGLFQTSIRTKTTKNRIIDDKVFKSTDLENKSSVVLSKNDFADLVSKDDEFNKTFKFDNFNLIFNIIKKIITSNS